MERHVDLGGERLRAARERAKNQNAGQDIHCIGKRLVFGGGALDGAGGRELAGRSLRLDWKMPSPKPKKHAGGAIQESLGFLIGKRRAGGGLAPLGHRGGGLLGGRQPKSGARGQERAQVGGVAVEGFVGHGAMAFRMLKALAASHEVKGRAGARSGGSPRSQSIRAHQPPSRGQSERLQKNEDADGFCRAALGGWRDAAGRGAHDNSSDVGMI